MKNFIVVCALAAGSLAAPCETFEEACQRLSARRGLWETNAWACVKSVPLASDAATLEANGSWFVDLMNYPDTSETNRIKVVLAAKTYAIRRFAEERGIYDNTNAWMALAAYVGRLRDIKDQRWLDRSQDVVTDTLDSGVRIMANGNPLLDFNAYKALHANADYTLWRNHVRSMQELQRTISKAELQALDAMQNVFWRHGAKRLSNLEKATIRDNIIEHARLTEEESRGLFGE